LADPEADAVFDTGIADVLTTLGAGTDVVATLADVVEAGAGGTARTA
jgi:hypothetical protein